jgi:uncharacterized membrane protein YphA (DoxX/SURF4 family)
LKPEFWQLRTINAEALRRKEVLMQAITRWNRWANAHTNVITDGLRVMFGGFLIFKGVLFMEHPGYLPLLLTIVSGKGNYVFLTHFITLVHLCGGALIVPGLVTRFASLVNIVILIGAVTVNFIGAMHFFSLVQAVTAFFIGAFFVFYGSGKHSVDKALRLHV